ncbi:MAG: hypothetical protein IKF06_02495 [Lachnospiraceae bacterium]|nr:hypothetical protein [Lachnospiraceae bacterium]
MISVLIGLELLLLCGAALGILTNRRTEECVPVVITGTIVFLYLFYCVNLLLIGRIVLYAGIAVLFAAGLFKLIKKKEGKAFWKSFFSPGIVLFLIFSVLMVIFCENRMPSVWDELRLWAAMPKALHFSQSLQVGDGSLLYSTMQSYPPGMALLVYFFTSFSGGFSYGSIFAVYFIFVCTLVLPAMKEHSWKQWFIFPAVFFLLILMPILLTVSGAEASGDWNFFFTCLYIDPILGCLMGHAFYQAVKRPSQDWFSTLAFTLVLFVLPAMKNIGALYAGVAFLTAFVVALMEKEKKGRNILFAIIPVAGAAVSYLSWQWIIRARGTGEFIDMQLSSFTGEKLLNVLKGMTTWGKIPFLYYALFFILVGVVLTFVVKDLPKRTALIGTGGFVLSFLIFFYGYVSHYGWMLSSIHRYTSTFTFAFFIYLLMRAVSGIRFSGGVSFVKSIRKAYLLLLLGLLLMACGIFLLFRAKHWQLDNKAWRDAERIIAEADAYVGSADSSGDHPEQPAKCYLALGGDIRRQSQRHETYALCAVGSKVNIRNIWCDKLFNEAEDGVVTDWEEMAEIWASHLLRDGYEYVIFAEPDEEIRVVTAMIAPQLGEVKDGMVVKVVPTDSSYGITLIP